MPSLGRIARRRLGVALAMVGMSAGLVGCGDAGSGGTPAPATVVPPSTSAATTSPPASTTTTTSTTASTSTTRTLPAPVEADLVLDRVFDTIYDLDPGSGRWPAVAGATVAVRGSLAGPLEASVDLLGQPFETWRLRVAEQVLGAPSGEELLVAHPLQNEQPWTAGGEAIYLLTPFIVAPGIIVPDLWVALGEENVIRTQLDEFAELLRAGEELLGTGLTRFLEPDAQEALAETRLVVEGSPDSEAGRGDVLGWDYVDVAVADPEVLWSDIGPLPPGPLVVRFAAAEGDAWLDSGVRRPLPLTYSPFEGRLLVAGGSLALTEEVLAGADRRTTGVLLDRAWGDIGKRRAAADAVLTELLRSVGRLPLPDEPFELFPEPPAPPPPPPPVVEVDYSQPFVIDQGGVRIVFDQWFWATLDPAARVQVVRDGAVVTEGPLSGEGAVSIRDEQTGDYVFLAPDGTPVASLSADELNAVIGARLAELAADG